MKIITSMILLTSFVSSQAEVKIDQSKIFTQAIQQLTNQPISIHAINETPISGIKQVVVNGGPTKQIIYISDDGEFLFDGNLMNLKNRTNLTELTEKSLRQELMTEFGKSHKTIDFYPENMTDHITVFTDIDCGYCRKLHQDVAGYNELGIGVSYLFFPRSGLNTNSHQKAVNVWCASDQQKAMTQAKNGETLEPLMCPNPIETQYNLGLGAGVHKVGTPAIVFQDGTMMPGYLPPQAMKQRIDQVIKK